MRKVLSVLLCVALLCSLVVVTAQADATPAASFDNAVVVPGASVTLNMSIDTNPGLASIKLVISDDDGLGVTFAGADNGADSLGITINDPMGTYYWSGAVNNYNTTFGTVTLTIPDEAVAGDYSFTVTASQGFDENGIAVALGNGTFTITVTDKVITGVNVAIDSGLSVGVHVQAADIEGVSITAVDVEGKEYATVEDYEEDEESGDYIFYVNVNPWAMNKDFKVDFTGAFVFDGEAIDLTQLPGTAKDIGILSYCEALLAGSPSDELKQLIADLLAFGQASQTYQKKAVMELPAGLTPTEAAWEDGNGDPCDFGTYCSENYSAQSITKGNNTASKKYSFASAKIEFGSKFSVTFAIDGNTPANARMVVEGTTYSLEDSNFTYALTPTQYAGIDFVLYGSSTTNNTNKCWTNNYGPAYYAAYLYDNAEEGSADIIDLLEAYYNYGVSAEAYVGSLS